MPINPRNPFLKLATVSEEEEVDDDEVANISKVRKQDTLKKMRNISSDLGEQTFTKFTSKKFTNIVPATVLAKQDTDTPAVVEKLFDHSSNSANVPGRQGDDGVSTKDEHHDEYEGDGSNKFEPCLFTTTATIVTTMDNSDDFTTTIDSMLSDDDASAYPIVRLPLAVTGVPSNSDMTKPPTTLLRPVESTSATELHMSPADTRIITVKPLAKSLIRRVFNFTKAAPDAEPEEKIIPAENSVSESADEEPTSSGDENADADDEDDWEDDVGSLPEEPESALQEFGSQPEGVDFDKGNYSSFAALIEATKAKNNSTVANLDANADNVVDWEDDAGSLYEDSDSALQVEGQVGEETSDKPNYSSFAALIAATKANNSSAAAAETFVNDTAKLSASRTAFSPLASEFIPVNVLVALSPRSDGPVLTSPLSTIDEEETLVDDRQHEMNEDDGLSELSSKEHEPLNTSAPTSTEEDEQQQKDEIFTAVEDVEEPEEIEQSLLESAVATPPLPQHTATPLFSPAKSLMASRYAAPTQPPSVEQTTLKTLENMGTSKGTDLPKPHPSIPAPPQLHMTMIENRPVAPSRPRVTAPTLSDPFKGLTGSLKGSIWASESADAPGSSPKRVNPSPAQSGNGGHFKQTRKHRTGNPY
ncbi:hypothetical protein CC86DRAFT_406502 [Ophiobolus disseminans]|uniref:Uncharacterized protein n=1 Tax=Ophiobolus disseminans TaxID=1469910 RepID=A0A6A6ZZX1_9PLEO|nr:hypothetical protein CC86DRAFT_406502 [Ophiobolus disseminans]